MLTTLAENVPPGDWIYEIKWDGYRIVATVAGGEPELRTRKDQDYTKRFENVAKELVKAAKTPDCVVDGEVCALDEDGRPSFSAMQQGKPGTPIVYFVFDLLEVDGEPLVDLPIEERRKRLEKLLDKRNKTVRYSETFDDGVALFKAAKQQHLEGIMAKRADSVYASGSRTPDWLKIKTAKRQEVVIAGFTAPRRTRPFFGALVLAVREGDAWRYIGHVGTGFSHRVLEDLHAKLMKLMTSKSPFPAKVKDEATTTWVKPSLVAEVKFAEWTSKGELRQPVYLGLRFDKRAKDVVRERDRPRK